MFKQCTKCRKIKPISEFHKRKISKDGYRNQCKYCRREWERNNKEIIKEKSHEYYFMIYKGE